MRKTPAALLIALILIMALVPGFAEGYERVGVVAAMDVEIDGLKADMELERIETVAGVEYYIGTLMGQPVVAAKSGVGKVNAAICVENMIDNYGCDAIINAGVAGSLSNEIDVGDIVISIDTVYHDVDCTALGCEPGELEQFDTVYFPADPELIALAQEVNAGIDPDTDTFTGRIASGDQFIASMAEKARIVEQFGALCVEMEGATTGHVAFVNDVPYVVIRAISDKADGSASVDYPTFEAEAAEHEILLIEGMMAELAGAQ